MRLLKLFIPGDSFIDAYVYMGYIIATTTNRSMRFYELQDLSDDLNSKLGGNFPLATYMFARNDWLSGSQFQRLLSDPDIKSAIISNVANLNTMMSTIPNEHFNHIEVDLPIDSNDILDVKCYSTRIYFATTDGLYHINIDWDNIGNKIHAHRRLNIPCQALSAVYGTINASCCEEGLYSVTSELDDYQRNKAEPLNQIAKKSLRTGWMHYDLINYENMSDLHFFKGEVAPSTYSGGLRERKVITKFKQSTAIRDLDIKEFNDYKLTRDNIQFSFNTANQIYYHTYNGELISWFNPNIFKEIQMKSKWRQSEGPGGRILSAAPSRMGMVIESDNNVKLLHENKWINLVEGPVLSVRTYLSSKRFQNIISIVTEEGIWLVAGWNPDLP